MSEHPAREQGFIDLHCHPVPAVDDGVRSFDEARELLRGLKRLGFGQVIATPHIHAQAYPNTPAGLRESFTALRGELAHNDDTPALELSAEHYVDDRFIEQLGSSSVLPYPTGRGILIEFPTDIRADAALRAIFAIATRGRTPVVAHPERYRCLAGAVDEARRWIDSGAELLLDAMSIGRMGLSRVARTARSLLDADCYAAAASDAHAPADVERVAHALEQLERGYGQGAVQRLLRDGPRRLLAPT